jgi:hypothetical protein
MSNLWDRPPHAEKGDIVHLLPALSKTTNGFEYRLPYRCRTVRGLSDRISNVCAESATDTKSSPLLSKQGI